MKTIQHLSAMAIITIIMGMIYAIISHATSQKPIPPTAGGALNGDVRTAGLENTLFAGWILCISVVLINWLVTFYHSEKNHATHDAK